MIIKNQTTLFKHEILNSFDHIIHFESTLKDLRKHIDNTLEKQNGLEFNIKLGFLVDELYDLLSTYEIQVNELINNGC